MQFQGLGGQFRFYLLKTNLKGDYKPESFKNQCFALKVSKQKVGWNYFLILSNLVNSTQNAKYCD